MEKNLDHRNNLNKLYSTNKDKVYKLKLLLESLDKIETNIERKIRIHQEYIASLQKSLKQSVDSYHSICENLL